MDQVSRTGRLRQGSYGAGLGVSVIGGPWDAVRAWLQGTK